MKILLIGVLAWMVIAPAWMTDFASAKEKAKQENKYILLNFSGSDWCGPCIKMKTEVFENEQFLMLAEQKLVLVRADFPRQKKNKLSKEQTLQNEALAEKYNRYGKFPLTLLLNSKGEIIRQWDGYVFGSQEKFIEELDKTIAK